MRVAVVGHLEWVEFVRVPRVPTAGDIVHGQRMLEVPAGGGAVAAMAMARWGAGCSFYTALGDDELGHRAEAELRASGVRVHCAYRHEPQRRAVTLVDPHRDRTIIVIGDRLVAHGIDPFPWEELAACEAVYITGGDIEAIRHARRARVVVATSRILRALREAAIEIDVLVGSANDPSERYTPGDLPIEPRVSVFTDGGRGGTFTLAGGTAERYAPVPAVVTGDTYGAGDTFAAGLTFALAERRSISDAIAFAAARAAEVVAYDGPYPPRST